MTTPRQELQGTAKSGVPTSLAKSWVVLFEPTSPLTLKQRREADELVVSGWQTDSLCSQADPEAWFPDKGAPGRPEVFRVCARCPVRRPCLASALRHGEYGVWAGTTAMDRRGLYRMLRAGAPVAEVLETALDSQHAPAGALEDAA